MTALLDNAGPPPASFAPLIRAAEAARQDEETATRRIEEAAERGAARQVAVASPGALLGAKQVAALLGIREDRVNALGRAGKLPRVKLGRNTYRYRLESVTAAIEALEA